jgi:8-oxo-dGTP pyrophosphatase MutT (NUDIX family)
VARVIDRPAHRIATTDALTDGVVTLRHVEAVAGRSRLAVEVDAGCAGSVTIIGHDAHRCELLITIDRMYRGRGLASRSSRLAIAYAFDTLGMARVETYVDTDNHAARWTATRSGMRLEGLLRGRSAGAGGRGDALLFARLRDDPDPGTVEGRIGLANAGLPTKRVVSKVLVRDHDGRVLMTQGPSGDGWDIPGGVVEPDEPPRHGAVREVREELDLDLSDTIGRLLLVDWLPPDRGWDDACLLVFDGGVHDARIVDAMTLQASEIGAVAFVEPADALHRALLPMARCLPSLLDAVSGITYLENHRPVQRG